MIKTVFIGAGLIAGTHYRSVEKIKELQVVGVCDLDLQRARKLAKRINCKYSEDFSEIIEDTNPDFVMLLTPRRYRLPVIEYCTENKIPIFMEKPPCHNIKTGEKIKELFKNDPVLHSVGFVNRYSPALNKVLKKIDTSSITTLSFCFSGPLAADPVIESYPDAYLVERSGGITGDQGIHYIDLARYITSSEVKKITGFANNIILPRSEKVTTFDNAAWIMEMKNKVLVTHSHTWSSRDWQCTLSIKSIGADIVVDFYANSACGKIKDEDFSYRGKKDFEDFHQELKTFVEAFEQKDQSVIRSDYNDAFISFEESEKLKDILYQ